MICEATSRLLDFFFHFFFSSSKNISFSHTIIIIKEEKKQSKKYTNLNECDDRENRNKVQNLNK